MDTKQLRKAAREKINTGASAQEAYEALLGGGNIPDEKLADIVRFIPTLDRRREYRTAHVALMALLVLAAILRLLVGPVQQAKGPGWLSMSVFVAACLACVVGLALYRGKAYIWSVLVVLLITMGRVDGWDASEWITGPLWIAMLAIVFLGIYLHKKVLANYITIKEPYTNAEGQARLREKVRFGD